MSIFFDNAEPEQGSGFTQQTDAPARVEKINMKNFTNSEILSALVALTHAKAVEPSPEDVELLRDLDEQRIRSEQDAKLSLEVRKRARRERELLEQAKGSMAQ
jgi:large subunit ribosomal protein MRP49